MPFVDRADVRIHYEVSGSGEPLVLLHSFLCSSVMWAPVLPALEEHFRVVNIDLRSHGQSPPVPGPFTLYDLVDDALAVLDAEGIESATWCGVSIGGMISLRAALRHPERVRRLVLIDTDGGQETGWARIKHTALGVVARLAGLGVVEGSVVRLFFGARARSTRPEVIDAWRERFRQLDTPAMLAHLDALDHRDDPLPQLSAVAQPALVLHGDADAALPLDRGKRLAETLPDARLVILPEGGHIATLEQPERVAEAMLAFLLA